MSDAEEDQLTTEDVALLRCPKCGSGLRPTTARHDDPREDRQLACQRCGERWPVEDDIPVLVDRYKVRLSDGFFRLVYDIVAPFHDAGTKYVLPILQWSSEASMRGHYLRRMRLDKLREPEGRRLRILEVGAGTGVNWPLIEDRLPLGLDVEFWAVDLSRRMLARGRRRARRSVGRRVRHVLADAHTLPFDDDSFDRVFHTGGIATYGDKRKALAEMARVARPCTPIVVVDERLDPMRFHLPYHYAMFYALTAYDWKPGAPLDELPRETKYRLTQASRFFYCLTFEKPQRAETVGDRRNLMTQLADILSYENIQTLKEGYGDGKAMSDLLAQFLPANYIESTEYSTAIMDEFYSGAMFPHDTPGHLSRPDRERCLIAILTSRGPDFNLGVHIYMALMNDVTAKEIATIIFLAGVYSGVDNLTEGFKIEQKTLATLQTLVNAAKREGKAALAPAKVLAELSKNLA